MTHHNTQTLRFLAPTSANTTLTGIQQRMTGAFSLCTFSLLKAAPIVRFTLGTRPKYDPYLDVDTCTRDDLSDMLENLLREKVRRLLLHQKKYVPHPTTIM